MVEPGPPPNAASDTARRWPAMRRIAWTALFVALIGWSSLIQPPPQPEVLLWDVMVPA
jgi:hypothetical protein